MDAMKLWVSKAPIISAQPIGGITNDINIHTQTLTISPGRVINVMQVAHSGVLLDYVGTRTAQ